MTAVRAWLLLDVPSSGGSLGHASLSIARKPRPPPHNPVRARVQAAACAGVALQAHKYHTHPYLFPSIGAQTGLP